MNYRINLSKRERAFVGRRITKFYDQAQRNPNRNLACPFGLHLKNPPKMALALEDMCWVDGEYCTCNIFPELSRGVDALCPCYVYGREEALHRLGRVVERLRRK